jgi:hypothetical protein
LSAQFTRAYTLDGKQWGQITFDIDLFIGPDVFLGKIRKGEGARKYAGTFDVVIDGSSRDSTMKGTVKDKQKDLYKSSAVDREIEGTIEKSVRMVK